MGAMMKTGMFFVIAGNARNQKGSVKQDVMNKQPLEARSSSN